jgi:hypothetical protein
MACLNGILRSKDIRKESKLNIYNALIKSSLLYGSETWKITENNTRRVEATEMDALRKSSRISRKEKIRNVTTRQQIGLEGAIIKEIEQNQLHIEGQRCIPEELRPRYNPPLPNPTPPPPKIPTKKGLMFQSFWCF